MATPLTPTWYLGVCRDQPSGDAVLAWGLDATGQLATGQIVTLPVCTVIDQASGLDVSTTLLSGSATIGPNAAGTANTVIIQTLTNAVAGGLYRLKAKYVPSPPSPLAEKYELVLDFFIVI
jgi:hypothetical protein